MLTIIVSGKIEDVQDFGKERGGEYAGVATLRERVWDGQRRPDRLWLVWVKRHNMDWVKRQAGEGYTVLLTARKMTYTSAEWLKIRPDHFVSLELSNLDTL